jgi:hypothetical protein
MALRFHKHNKPLAANLCTQKQGKRLAAVLLVDELILCRIYRRVGIYYVITIFLFGVFVDVDGSLTFNMERCLAELFKASLQAQPSCFFGFYCLNVSGS